jgi:uncharacterized protein
MRIIAFGDIHMATDPLENIPGIQDADLLLLNGDLTNYGSKKEAKLVLNDILTYNTNILALLGNLDNYDINEYLDQLDINLHGKAYLFQNKVCLIGVGGSNITPFKTPTEYSEEELGELLKEAHAQAKEFIALAEPLVKTKIPTVLVSHTPPEGTKLDRIRNGQHVGSTAVRTYIEKYQPSLCITGHIHEGKGEDSIGDTHIINHGMFRHNGWVDIHIENAKVTATLQ